MLTLCAMRDLLEEQNLDKNKSNILRQYRNYYTILILELIKKKLG